MMTQEISQKYIDSLFENYRRYKQFITVQKRLVESDSDLASSERKILATAYESIIQSLPANLDVEARTLKSVKLKKLQRTIDHLGNRYIFSNVDLVDIDKMRYMDSSYETYTYFYGRPSLNIAGQILKEIIFLDEREIFDLAAQIFSHKPKQLLNFLISEIAEVFLENEKVSWEKVYWEIRKHADVLDDLALNNFSSNDPTARERLRKRREEWLAEPAAKDFNLAVKGDF